MDTDLSDVLRIGTISAPSGRRARSGAPYQDTGVQWANDSGKSHPEPGPSLTLTLSPPIRWERRGKSKLGRMVTRETGSLRQIQGFNARMIRGLCQVTPIPGREYCVQPQTRR